MSGIISVPIKLTALVAAGLAFAAGWKLGCYLGDVIAGEKEFPWPGMDSREEKEQAEPLWKRKFSKVSAD